MNIGIIIGATALMVGVMSLVVALVLRNSNRAEPAKLLRYFFLAGIPILFLCSAAGFWDCYTSKDWTKCLVPIAMLLFAVNGLINRKQCMDLIENFTGTKQRSDERKSTNNEL
jgi:uncharacterized membrane protein YfcA